MLSIRFGSFLLSRYFLWEINENYKLWQTNLKVTRNLNLIVYFKSINLASVSIISICKRTWDRKKKANRKQNGQSLLHPYFIFRPVCEISILVFSASIVVVSDLVSRY
jgi:hypothetical protein